ncbi:hypothetical protein AvCA_40630 [Azotobacter vinelandii CA]|uniref:Uncharacterized protein n=2 Tax=Azotobacter vinelandii TaxID=354 RepID=C1DE90_AZOVD|nr:hypothetical protein [Azotobacter vinelandii]ACO80198.1 hypothetical protein Avin_40630 [Azotobacter vinelandii DJ]AGK14461.1 hypothetical protein AvCA_40630 [Azotobacter vinelandii CA]AGK21761.1 hypothetical protein AvCA6_40630 [Azotobacter vinelandii CA6]WKN20999.1 hypothetical protein AVAEIV_004047 [Azotobacter vinelandii]SFX73187.1 hypothetical protein SAMN04244547_02570 [Azotobacter vinelandii]
MSRADWNALLPNHETIEAMSPEKLEAAGQATEDYGMNIGFGIAAIGNLLAGTATNDDHGLDPDAMSDLGWLLETLGKLSAKLADTGNGIRARRAAIQED